MMYATTEFIRTMRLALNLALYEVRAQRKETFLGLLWLILWPVTQSVGFLLAFRVVRGEGLQLGGQAMLLAYFGVLIWTTASSVLLSNLTILKNNRDLVSQVVFPCSVLSVVDVTAKFLYFLAQATVALAIWFVMAPDGQAPAALAYLLLYGIGFYLVLLAMAWVASILGVVLPDLSFVLPPVLTLLLVLSPIFQPDRGSLPWAVQLLNDVNPFSFCVTAWYATIGVTGGGAHAPWLFVLSAVAAVGVSWATVRVFYPQAMKVI
jgi:lipopolysaccharide transport system permease protein